MNAATPAEAPSMAVQLASTALALAFVLVLAWLALRALKRLQQRSGGAGGGDAPQVLRSVNLTPRERLVTVRWQGRDYLLGVAAGSVTRIADVAAPPDAPAGPAAPAAHATPPRGP